MIKIEIEATGKLKEIIDCWAFLVGREVALTERVEGQVQPEVVNSTPAAPPAEKAPVKKKRGRPKKTAASPTPVATQATPPVVSDDMQSVGDPAVGAQHGETPSEADLLEASHPVSKADLTDIIRGLLQGPGTGKGNAVRDLLVTKYNCPVLNDVPEDQYEALYADLLELQQPVAS